MLRSGPQRARVTALISGTVGTLLVTASLIWSYATVGTAVQTRLFAALAAYLLLVVVRIVLAWPDLRRASATARDHRTPQTGPHGRKRPTGSDWIRMLLVAPLSLVAAYLLITNDVDMDLWSAQMPAMMLVALWVAHLGVEYRLYKDGRG